MKHSNLTLTTLLPPLALVMHTITMKQSVKSNQIKSKHCNAKFKIYNCLYLMLIAIFKRYHDACILRMKHREDLLRI